MSKEEKHPGGRPTTYSQEIIDRSRQYLNEYEKVDDLIPSVEGLASYIERARSTIYDWANHEDKKEFSDILDEINETQKKVLINKGLSGDFNSNITKLVLGKHGLSERLQQEISGVDGKSIQYGVVILPEIEKEKD